MMNSFFISFMSEGLYYNNANILILWAIFGLTLAFLGHWQKVIDRPMPWFLH
jgi:hypothetical protein